MPPKPGMEIDDVFEEKARAGDGAYAVAFALLRLSDVQEADSRSRSLASQEQMRGLKDVAEALSAICNGTNVHLSGKVETGD